jgi:flagellar biosynthesis protein FlhB
MSEHAGEKTEQATPRRMEEAIKRGQIARSPEVQTVFVLLAGLIALQFSGAEVWRHFANAQFAIFGQLHEIELTLDGLQHHAIRCVLVLLACIAPIALATCISGLLAGAIQNRFQGTPEALRANWERLNPIAGFGRIFGGKALVPTGVSIAKLLVIAALSYSEVKRVLDDPVFHTAIDASRIATFLASAALGIGFRIVLALAVIAACDYGYQYWKTNRDLMMTREEVKEELKNSEGNPHVKARQRQRRRMKTIRQMLVDVPKADVIVTNPTHLAIALRYDRKTMKAPRIIAKGARLNALKIREVAAQHQIPIIENKPLARMMFKHGRVGGEIPVQLYAAVAELLAYVYRINRYRYYAQENAGQ